MKPPRVMPYRTETELQQACQKRIRGEWGGEVIKIHGSAAQQRGTPDLLACVRGRFVAVECKQPGKHPTALQLKRLRDWQRAGAIAGVVRTEVDLDDLLDHVDDPGWHNPVLDSTERMSR